MGRRRSADFAVRRKPRRSPRRLLRRAGVGLAVLAVLGGLGWWLAVSDLFAVARVETGVYRFTSADELEPALSALLGHSIWTVGRADAAAAVAGLPWVRDLRLGRRLPSTVALTFTEWRPLVAVAQKDDALDVLVGDGRVLAFPDHLPAPGLPVLVGVAARPDSAGVRRLDPAQLPGVLELLEAVESTGLETAVPVDFVVAHADGFAIVLQDGYGTLLVGREEFADRLQRYMVGRSHLDKGLEIDLRFRDKITVRRPDPPHP